VLAGDVARTPFQLLVNTVASSPLVPRPLRIVLYRLAGIRITVADVFSRVTITSSRLSIGSHVTINNGCLFDTSAPITIGAHTRIGQRAMFITSTHRIGSPGERAGERYDEPIVVGAGAWIGAGALVLPGVTIEEGCVVAAGAVVTGDCAANGLYAGVPARRIRDLE
jgi:maltose O-acetyltransferase